MHIKKGTARKFWVKVHLWIALSIGLVLALIGLSGSMLVLRAPILQWEVGSAAVRLHTAPAPGAVYASEQQWRDAAQTAYPELKRVMGTSPPRGGFLVSDNAMVFGMGADKKGMVIVMVDPYTAEPRAYFMFNELLLAKFVAFHRALLLPPKTGSLLLAIAGIVLLVSLLTGIWLWYPRNRQWHKWRAALTVHFKDKGLRFWMGLHNVAAVYLFVPMLVLTVTGIWLAKPGWFTASMRGARPDAMSGPGQAVREIMSGLHAQLMLGFAGEVLVFLAGIALPVLYVSGLVMWWRKRKAKQLSALKRQ